MQRRRERTTCGIWGRSSSGFPAPAPAADAISAPESASIQFVHSTRCQRTFTDSPPFLSTDAFTPNPVIPEESLVAQIELHAVALQDIPGRRPSIYALSLGWLRYKATICRQWFSRSSNGRHVADRRKREGCHAASPSPRGLAEQHPASRKRQALTERQQSLSSYSLRLLDVGRSDGAEAQPSPRR